MRIITQALLLGIAAAVAPPAYADFYIVVQANNSLTALTRKEAVDLFMGRSRAFPNGDFALPFDLPRDSPRRAAFYQALTGMNAAEVNSHWSRLMFSGQNMPPHPLPDETTIVEIVKRNQNAIAWLSKEPNDKQLRTLLVIKE
ncbi:MAG: hypothetical protein HEQ39_02805 [Rhizobacter sp.]